MKTKTSGSKHRGTGRKSPVELVRAMDAAGKVKPSADAIASSGQDMPLISEASEEDRAAFAIAAKKAIKHQGIDLNQTPQSSATPQRVLITDSRPGAGTLEISSDEEGGAAAPVEAPANSEESPVEGDSTSDADNSGQAPAPTEVQNQGQEQPAQPDTTEIVLNALRLFNQQHVEPLQTQLQETQSQQQQAVQEAAAANSKVQELEAQLSSAKEDLTAFSNLSQFLGKGQEQSSKGNTQVGAPNLLSQTNSQSDRQIGAYGEFCQELEQASRRVWSQNTNSFQTLSDTTKVNEFVKQNRAAFRRDLEKSMKNAGLLQGRSNGTQPENSAATTMADVVGGFLPALAADMRQNNRAGYIWHQFVTTRINFLEGQGGTIEVPRAAFNAPPIDPNDRRLSGGGVYVPLVDNNQSINTGTVPFTIEEWGLGGPAPNSAPIGIPTFVQKYSLINLLTVMQRNLWHDYIQWEDLKARSLYAPTSRVVYNKKNRVTTDETTLTNGDGGTATAEFAIALTDYAKTLLIPPLPDNCYIWVVPTKYLMPLRESLDVELIQPAAGDLEIVIDYIENTTGGYVDRVTGYKGKIGNVHLFEGNSWGIGAPGSDGVQSEPIMGQPMLTRSGYFFGADTTGRGIGQEFNVRLQNGEMHWNRLLRAVWFEHSGWGPMDVDPVGYLDTSIVPQQLRVIETRCLDIELPA